MPAEEGREWVLPAEFPFSDSSITDVGELFALVQRVARYRTAQAAKERQEKNAEEAKSKYNI